MISQVTIEPPPGRSELGSEDCSATRPSTPWSTSHLIVVGQRDHGGSPALSSERIIDESTDEDSQEFKLPPLKSLFVVVAGNALFQFSFFSVVASASAYAERLGGTSTFAGLTIGIPTLFSGIALLFVRKYDKGGYVRPFNIAYAAMILGNLLHALAFVADYLYLILIGRIVTGFGFTSFMFVKRYCSDPRIVGIRRRTMLASCLVLGQGFGFTAGPFVGGALYKVGFSNKIFNGYTSPGWIVAGAWIAFWMASQAMFEEVPVAEETLPLRAVAGTSGDPTVSSSPTGPDSLAHSETILTSSASESFRSLDRRQWGVIICMCYYAMTCFFVLASWEANIPVFSAVALNYSPFQAGNFIALGGVATLPFLLLNIRLARRMQDRTTLATGSSLGLIGLLVMLIILRLDRVSFASFYICWFLVALGFNLASTCTLSLLSKQMPNSWNGRLSMAVQYSNYAGRVTGAILGGSGVKIGMNNYILIQIIVVGIGGLMHMTLWRELKAKTG